MAARGLRAGRRGNGHWWQALRAIAGIAAFFVASCTTRLRTPAPASVADAENVSAGWRTLTLGLCEDYPKETRSLARARADLAAARAAGATTLRIAFGWDAMEPERGRFDWSFWDEFVPAAVNEFGLRLIPYVCYTPRWAARDQGNDFWRSPPRDPEDFGRFMTALVQRYRGLIHSWELWNEPDNRAYWLGTPAEFSALVRAGSRAVRAADPRATIVLGGIATDTNFLDALFREEHLAPAVDVVNLHSYYETWHPDPIEWLPRYLARAAAIVREHGENEPLWMAEAGYSSVNGRAAVSEVYRAHYRGEHTETAQAAALVRLALTAITTDDLPLFAWYRINDLPSGEDVIGDDNNRHLGVRRVDGTAKPALAAFAQLARLFAQPFRPLVPQIRATETIGPPAEVRAFELRDGRRIVAAWLGMPPSEKDPALARTPPAEDTRRAHLRIRLPHPQSEVAARLRATDAVGNAVPSHVARWSPDADGGQLELQLAGGELVLCVLEPIAAPARAEAVTP